MPSALVPEIMPTTRIGVSLLDGPG
jgi:hypothetical protein